MTPETTTPEQVLTCSSCSKRIIRTPKGGPTCLYGHVSPADTLACDADFVTPFVVVDNPLDRAERELTAGYVTGYRDRMAPRPWALRILAASCYGQSFAEGYGRGWAAASVELADRAQGVR